MVTIYSCMHDVGIDPTLSHGTGHDLRVRSVAASPGPACVAVRDMKTYPVPAKPLEQAA